MKIWFATSNKGKLQEAKRLLDLPGIELRHQGELSAFTPRPEDGKTFKENALIKVKSLAAVKDGLWVIGEDSGLEAEGLNNFPGIHSARYAGDNASDAENTAKLLKMIKIRSSMNRNARFYCCLIARSPEGQILEFEGEVKGTIALAQKGSDGFGYDPVFIPEGEDKTFAELGISYKMQNSHRAKAFKQFNQHLKSLL